MRYLGDKNDRYVFVFEEKQTVDHCISYVIALTSNLEELMFFYKKEDEPQIKMLELTDDLYNVSLQYSEAIETEEVTELMASGYSNKYSCTLYFYINIKNGFTVYVDVFPDENITIDSEKFSETLRGYLSRAELRLYYYLGAEHIKIGDEDIVE